jgi:hypothetical protein
MVPQTEDKTMPTIHQKVQDFAAQWEQEQGYKPATFQKAIAMQRLERGQSIREIIDALIAQRVS